MPVTEYDHSGGNCSVTGGYVYRGPGSPRLQGVYLYGDYCSGKVWGLKRDNGTWQSQQIASTTYSISTFGEDEAANLYVADFAGTLYQVTDPVAAPCERPGAGALSAAGRFRVVLPLRTSWRHRFEVAAVRPEAPGVVSVYLTGERLGELGAEAGQFLRLRFPRHR